MTTRVIAASVGALVVAALAMPASGGVVDRRRGARPYIVVLARSASAPRSAASLESRAGISEVRHVFRSTIKGYSATMTREAAATLAHRPEVASVEPDRLVTADVQRIPTGIRRIGANRNPVSRIDRRDRRVDVDVALIDTGIDGRHPDLNVVGGRSCVRGVGFGDGYGHGTHTAGTVGAIDNRRGVVGVAPGARLWSVRVLDASGSGRVSDLICGINWVTRHARRIEVANMSLGTTGSDGGCRSGALHRAVCRSVRRGVTYTVSAGNDAANASSRVPAAFDEVITVSALADFDGAPGGRSSAGCSTDRDDTFANFSNYGRDVDVIAPGVCIRSTWRRGGYNTLSGTSMAAPHVAGAAAVYLSRHPGASPQRVKRTLRRLGSTDWRSADDPDGRKERLVRAARMK